jgi:voltage-gated sodium channel
VIIGVIIANAIVLGMETVPAITSGAGGILYVLDRLFLAFFVAELSLKLVAYRSRFFKNGWNIFDTLLVALTAMPVIPGMEALSSLRILRLLRLLALVPQMRAVVHGLLGAIPGLVSVVGLLAMLQYIAAILATKLLGDTFPELFGSLSISLFSLFQMMTLEGWSDEIVRPVMEVYPYATPFFILYIIVSTFAVLNLVIGVIVNAMQKAQEVIEREHRAETESIEADLHEVKTTLARIEEKLRR